jgi:hypothetical protein
MLYLYTLYCTFGRVLVVLGVQYYTEHSVKYIIVLYCANSLGIWHAVAHASLYI